MDKKEGMNRWKMARTFRPLTFRPLLLWGGLAAALLWGCFNPIMSAPDQGSENQGSADQGSENPGDSPGPNDGAAGEFTVTLRVGDGGPETGSRSVVGPGAEDIRYVGVWNTVQVIAVDAETQKVKDNQLVKLDNENDSGKTIWPNVAQGKRYHFLVLVGHTELNYANEDPEYEYKSDPPTLLAAGFLGDQAIHGQATLSVTMKPLVVDTFFKHGGVPVPAVLPDVNGKGVQLPAGVAASVVWEVSGGFDTLVDAQTRTGLPGGINWGGLTLTEQKTIVRFKDTADDWKDAVLVGADRNQIVLNLGEHDKGVSGSANFNLTYNPLGVDEGEGASLWIIRNGINDKAQNKATTFTRDSNGKILWNDLEVSDPKAANGNGAVAFSFENDIITHIDLTDLVPAPVTGAAQITAIGGKLDGNVAWKGTGEAKSTTLFEGETVYAATVTLEPAAGFQFSTDGVTVTHSGNPVILDVSQKDPQKVVKEVYFPATGAWEYGGYFSGKAAVAKDSAIDVMKLAADFSSLSLKLLPWQETVALNDTDTDIGKDGGLTLTHIGNDANSPAAVTIDGGGKTIPLTKGTGSVITVGKGVTLTLRNITFEGLGTNTGGLISVAAGGTLVLEDGAVITGNGAGGGVSVSGADGKLVMKAGAISDNTGTGVAVGAGGVFELSGGTISGNTTASPGGGVSVAAGGTFTMNGGIISNNKTAATNGGGGVYMAGGGAGGEFTMSGGTISGNETTVANQDGTNGTSGTSGGGVSVYGGTFTMSGTAIISDNTTAYNMGDGVYVNGNGTQFVMDGGEISGHNRIGVGIDNSGEFTMNGGKIHHNTNTNGITERSGGGVRVGKGDTTKNAERKATFKMTGGEITENKGQVNTDGDMSSGGGVWLSPSTADYPVTFTMKGGTISKNTGGGVYMATSYTVFDMEGGTISGNTNGLGGGVMERSGKFTMSGGIISGNTATNGGGVYQYAGTFDMSGTASISGNTATTTGGGVYVFGGSSATFNKQSGGIIYGVGEGAPLANTAGSGNGHAAFSSNGPKIRDSTAGTGVPMYYKDGSATGWDN